MAPHLNCPLAQCVFNASTVLIGTRIALSQQRCVFTPGLDLPRHAGGPGLAAFYRSIQSVERLCEGPMPLAVEEIQEGHMVIGVVLLAALALQFRALALLCDRARPPRERAQQD